MNRITIGIVSYLLPTCLCAQWLHFRQPGIPRTPDGKPDLTAPLPRTSDGKPDLSGLWAPAPNPYPLDLIGDIKNETIFKPAAEAMFQKHINDYRRDDPAIHCLPLGPAEALGGSWRIIQSPAVVGLLHSSGNYRQIYLDGREPPRDPDPTWRGYSVGHWDGDTLVIETSGFNDRSWLDRAGHPHSESLRVTERFHRVDFGHMQFEITFRDPETLTEPLTISLAVNYLPDTEMSEYVCENERDVPHLVGRMNEGVKLRPASLAKYAGTYEFREGPPGFPGRPVNFAEVNGRLYSGVLPMVPQSETRFDSLDGVWQFSLDASGTVTGVIRSEAEGDFQYVRRP
jgi:hypothetical protein